MADTPNAANVTAFAMQKIYRWVCEAVADLSEEQLRWQPNPTTPSIRFHLFHIARWADDLHQVLSGADRQIWEAEETARQWGLDSAALGIGESGETLEGDAAQALPLPERDVLLAYCTRVLMLAEQTLAGIDDAGVDRIVVDGEETHPVGHAIVGQLSHSARHLGMIEALKGVQGLPGTATD
jgi:hypothetical protein